MGVAICLYQIPLLSRFYRVRFPPLTKGGLRGIFQFSKKKRARKALLKFIETDLSYLFLKLNTILRMKCTVYIV